MINEVLYMYKWNFPIICLVSLIGLTSCGCSSSTTTSSSEEYVNKYLTLEGNVFNVAEGNLSGIEVQFGETKVNTDENGYYKFSVLEDQLENEQTLTVNQEGYEQFEQVVSLTEDTSVDIELIRTRAYIGTLSDDSFSLYMTRSSKGLNIIATTSNEDWFKRSNDSIQIYFSTKVINSQLNVDNYVLTHTSYGHVYIHDRADEWHSFDLNDISYTSYVEEEQLNIEYVIPYTKFGLIPSDVIGLSMTRSVNDNVTGTLIANVDNYLTIPEYPPFYVRIDAVNNIFLNEYNCHIEDNPTLAYDKEELIKNKTIRFALPGVAHKNADDIYVEVIKSNSSIIFDMVGFGSLEDNEQIKIVLHTSLIDGKAWALQASDVSILASKTSASMLTNQTFLWDYYNVSQGKTLINSPQYSKNEKGYFDLY